MTRKNCFMNAARPCDLTCKAAFEVDDPVDNIDCHFVWLAFHFGEGLFEFRRHLESQGGGPGGAHPGGPGPGHGTPPTKGPKGFPSN